MINTNRGYTRIDSLFNPDYLGSGETILNAPKGLMVHTSEGFRPVKKLYSKVVDQVVKITTNKGKSLTGTPNHPVQVVRESGAFEWVSMEEIQAGDIVVSHADRQAWTATSTSLLNSAQDVLNSISRKTTNIKLGELPEVLTEDLCRVMGYLTADGRLATPTSIGFTNNSVDKRNLFKEAWDTCFPEHPLKETLSEDNRTPSIGTSCKFVKLFFELRCGFKNVLAGDKELPTVLLSAPRSHVLAFLEAYMSCDGELGSSHAVFSSASFLFTRQLAHVLTTLGIPNTVKLHPVDVPLHHKTKGSRVGKYGSVLIKRNDFDSLTTEFTNFHRPHLVARDARLLNQTDFIPFLRKILYSVTVNQRCRIGQSFGWKTSEGKTIKGGPLLLDKRALGRSPHLNRLTVNPETGSSHPLLVDFDLLREVNAEVYSTVLKLIDTRLRYEVVESKRTFNTPTRVYDLVVPSNEQFFGNGLLCHNTVMATYLVCRVGQKTLILAHQTEWLSQFRETFLGSDTQKGFTNARPHQIQICKTYEQFLETDVCLATFSTFMSEKGKALLRKIRNLFNVIIIDEVQGVPAKESSRVTAQFNFNILLGLSGTPARKRTEEWQLADDLVGPILVETKVPRLQPTVEVLETTKQEFKASQGQAGLTYLQSRLENNKARRSVIIRDIIKRAKSGHLVLVPLTRVNSILSWTREINEQMETPGYALPFYGGLKKDMRMKIVEKARKFQCRVVIGNIALLSTGLNIPRASCLYEVGVNNNIPKAGQRFARILTPMDDKPTPVVVFTLDNCDIMRRCRQNEFWNCLIKDFNPRILPETKRALLSYFANTKKRKEMDDNSFLRDGL
jgi:hypothetical protein